MHDEVVGFWCLGEGVWVCVFGVRAGCGGPSPVPPTCGSGPDFALLSLPQPGGDGLRGGTQSCRVGFGGYGARGRPWALPLMGTRSENDS